MPVGSRLGHPSPGAAISFPRWGSALLAIPDMIQLLVWTPLPNA